MPKARSFLLPSPFQLSASRGKGLCSKGREKRIVLVQRGIGGPGKRKEEIGGVEGRGGSQFRKSISELSFPDCLLCFRPSEGRKVSELRNKAVRQISMRVDNLHPSAFLFYPDLKVSLHAQSGAQLLIGCSSIHYFRQRSFLSRVSCNNYRCRKNLVAQPPKTAVGQVKVLYTR